MIPPLHIYLLGDFRLDLGDEAPITIPQARHQALLTYLLLHRHAPQARRHLAFLLWPDSSESQALTNLCKALTHLRQLAPLLAQALYADHQVVQWRLAIAYTLDVAEFENKLDQATAAEQAGRAQEALRLWSAAVVHYTGPLTPSCYDDWIITERERLHQLCLGALERLVTGYERQQELAAAIGYAQQLLRLDPLQETTYVQLMRLQALLGERAAALRTYHTCVTVLARELGVEPAPETQEVYARLLNLETRGKTIPRPRSAKGLVGRQAEWEQLQRAWRLATTQGAHFLCIWGEAGIGKTRLAEELLTWAGQQGFTVARTRAYAGEGQLAYAPVVEWLRAEPVCSVRSRLAPVWLSEVARLAPELLSELPTVPPPNPMTEPCQRQRLWEALARALLAAAQPLLLVIDDLQWCDTETLEWLRYLLHFAPKARLLVLGTARPEEVDAAHSLQTLCRHLRSVEQLTEMEFGPLNAEQSAVLAVQVAQQSLTDQAQAVLYRATAGNPLFIVEMVRARVPEDAGEWHSESTALPHVATPAVPLSPKMQAVIQSRLAHLSPTARDLAHIAAVVGQDFTFELLLHASGQDEDALARGLDELWQRRLIREHGAAAYDFSHDRIRDVAYVEISLIRRRQLHRHVAEALEVLYAEALDSVTGQLAVHYDKAGAIRPAIAYYQQAATAAQRVFAYKETVAHLNRLLSLLDLLPETAESNEQKLDILLLLGQVLIRVKGYTAAEVEITYNQARVLCEFINDVEKRIPVLSGLRSYWGQRCAWQTVVTLEATMLRLAQQTQKVTHLQTVFQCMGETLVHQGDFKAAHDYIQHIASFDDPKPSLIHRFDSRLGPGLDTLCRLAETFWFLGYPEQAQTKMDEALTLARKLGQPFEMLYTLDFVIEFVHNCRQQQVAQALIEEYRTLVAKHSFPYHVAEEMIHRGWLLAQTGKVEAGIDLLNRGLEAWGKQGILLYLPYYQSWLVEVYGWTNQPDQGLALLAEALTLVQETGEQFWLAELHRLKGEFLLAQGNATAEAESCFQIARQIARQQQAKSLELRAAMSLARLWQQQGQVTEAYELLAKIYGWFTEGFDTADLVEAKQLLAELQRNCVDIESFRL